MTKIVEDISFALNEAKIKKKLMINGQQYETLFKEMIVEAKEIAKPRAIYQEYTVAKKGEEYIVIDGIKFVSKILRKNLDSAERVIVYVLTVGQEIADWAENKKDLLLSYWADEIQKEILNSAASNIYHKLDQLLTHHGKNVSEMNPGSLPDWPIEEQKKLFSLLGNVRSGIGVELTDSYLMLPAKSVSGIKFPLASSFENCALCQREDCPNRRVPFNLEKYNEINMS